MKTAVYQEALDAFANPLHEFTIEELGTGYTNRSYKVTSRVNGISFLLQQINRQVFHEPSQVQANYETLWNYLQSENIPIIVPSPKYFPDESTLFVDSHENYWRVFEFINGGLVLEQPDNADQVRAAAQTFGGFTASFGGFDLSTLFPTIPDFHNLSVRLAHFHQRLHNGHYERLSKAAPIVEELKQRERYASFYDVLTSSEEFLPRVMHHDATISNIIFDSDKHNVICLTDLDTVMPGYIFSDLGEMVRTMAASHNQDSTLYDKLEIRKDFYEAVMEGYLSLINYQLTEAEKKYAPFSGLMMTYMQAIRLLTDYLDGDKNFRAEYREQNLDRARNQLTLLKRLEEFLERESGFRI